MKVEGSVRVKSALVMDDCRREDNGKLLMVGVYGPEVVVPEFPASVTLAFWHELEIFGAGSAEVVFRVTLDDGATELVKVGAMLEVSTEKAVAAFVIGNVKCEFSAACELVVEMKSGDGDWTEVHRKQVITLQLAEQAV